LLTLEDVGATYGVSPVLTGIQMEIAVGEAITLLGRNGVGKTALLHTIAGLHSASSGNNTFAG
jgi:ABC-type branched-subunit amino acid transport system ATPase component